MGKYLKEFELISQYEEYINSDMAILPNVSIINDINGVYYNPKVPNYLKFTAEEDNSTISLNSKTSPDIKYSLNGGDWTQWDYSAITLNTGDTVYMKGNNSNGFSTNGSCNQFKMTGKIGASGNIMSLLYEDEFEGKLTIPCDYCFCYMFYYCKSLTNAPELPATTLTERCYQYMFKDCTSLIDAPELPATTLAKSCYQYMFQGCTSLTNASELPATTLVDRCYDSMFDSCTSLTNAPELPATTLAVSCYYEMFNSCTSITTAPELPATTLAVSCYTRMFQGCTSLTNASELPATTLAGGCYSGMFANCPTLTTVPELPATTLVDSCYYSMFENCTSLTTAPELPALTLTNNCYKYMFDGCTKLNYIKMLATNISATSCLYRWVTNVSSTGTFVKYPNMTSLPTGINGIPNGWTVQDAA